MADLTTKAINTYGLNDETLGLGHKVLVVGDSAEYLTLVSDIAKKIVEDYAGSTLAGSAQSIASAFTQVPLLAGVNTILTSGTDLNTVTTVGTYNASNAVARSLVNGPEGVTLNAFRMTVEKALGTGSEWYRQTIILGASVYSGYRRYTAGGATWSAWEKIPERSEMNKITDITGIFNTNLTTAGSSTQQYNVPNSSQHLVILQAASRTAHGIYLVSATSSGIMQLTEVIKGENITVTAPSANTLEIVNAYTNACYFNDICLRGSAITKVTASTNSAQSESI